MELPPGAVAAIDGANGQLVVYPDKVRITRKGVRAKVFQGLFAGEKDIYFSQIGSVLVKQAGYATLGYISFAAAGNVQRRGHVLDAVNDENTVSFGRKVTPQFLEGVRQYIEARTRTPAQTTATPDPMDQLKKLSELHDAGVITDDEYEAKRQELLARI